jgi:hypothetical protein
VSHLKVSGVGGGFAMCGKPIAILAFQQAFYRFASLLTYVRLGITIFSRNFAK